MPALCDGKQFPKSYCDTLNRLRGARVREIVTNLQCKAMLFTIALSPYQFVNLYLCLSP